MRSYLDRMPLLSAISLAARHPTGRLFLVARIFFVLHLAEFAGGGGGEKSAHYPAPKVTVRLRASETINDEIEEGPRQGRARPRRCASSGRVSRRWPRR